MTSFLDTLFTFSGTARKTFEGMKRLNASLGFPHQKFRSIHIGGTNGKGSVSLKIYQALRKEGYRVGLYTSPHIHSFRERIIVNDEMIPEQTAENLMELILSKVDEKLSFFDLVTTLAFLYFSKMELDWAVIEVGLGGRLDSTNIIDPHLIVMTSIGLDHMNLLGNSLEEIAKEKEGIVKEGIPFIVGPSAAKFFPQGKLCGFSSTPFYDDENKAIAIKALEELNISRGSIDYGVQFRPPCRFERIGDTILDVAHNSSGFEKLMTALRFHFPNEKFHFIVAFSIEKDWQSCLAIIKPYALKISFVNGDNPRFHSLGNLKIKDVLAITSGRDVICGSFYIMDEAKSLLSAVDPKDCRGIDPINPTMITDTPMF